MEILFFRKMIQQGPDFFSVRRFERNAAAAAGQLFNEIIPVHGSETAGEYIFRPAGLNRVDTAGGGSQIADLSAVQSKLFQQFQRGTSDGFQLRDQH